MKRTLYLNTKENKDNQSNDNESYRLVKKKLPRGILFKILINFFLFKRNNK